MKSRPDADLLTVRSVNEFTYCPRLFWLEKACGDFAHNRHTVEGKDVHRNLRPPGGSMPPPEADEDGPPWQTRSLWLSDSELGVSGKIDLVETTPDEAVMPVDYKKGSPPEKDQMWDTDRVQLTLQGLLLRSRGYRCESMAVWYHGSRQRVQLDLTEPMIQEARAAVRSATHLLHSRTAPPPLEDSGKCPGCSLSPICQPDEVNALGCDHLEGGPPADRPIRRIVPAREDAVPLYVRHQGAYVGKTGECLKIKPPARSDKDTTEVGLGRISQLNLMGAVQVSTQATQTCLRNGIPVGYFSTGGWFYGLAMPLRDRQVHRRIAQYETARGEAAAGIAATIVSDKIHNARTMIRRDAEDSPGQALARMAHCCRRAESCTDSATLLGLEGTAARAYWQAFNALVEEAHEDFRMGGRNRRPPEDPVNALLSYGYAILLKDCVLAVRSVGLDPYLGLFHESHHGQPALALDLMEIFRPLIVDSAVLRVTRRGDVKPEHFIRRGQSVAMKKAAKGALIREYERRMDSLLIHPVFGYRISYRRTIHVHARLLGRVLTGELEELPHLRNR